MNEMSGSFDLPSGVGTQMTIASASPRASPVGCTARRPLRTSGWRSAVDTSSTGLVPAVRSARRAGSASTPITRKPARAKPTASGRPT